MAHKNRTRCQEGFRRLAIATAVVALLIGVVDSSGQIDQLANDRRVAEEYSKAMRHGVGVPISAQDGELLGFGRRDGSGGVDSAPLSTPDFLDLSSAERIFVARKLGIIAFDSQRRPLDSEGQPIPATVAPGIGSYMGIGAASFITAAIGWSLVRALGWLVSGFVDALESEPSK